MSEQDGERDAEQDDGHRGGGDAVAALALVEDVDRGHLGPEREVPRDDHDRADLADDACEGHRDAGEDPREDVRQHDPPEDRVLAGAERAGRLLHLRVELESTGCTVRTTNGSDTKQSTSTIADRVNARWMPTGECGP